MAIVQNPVTGRSKKKFGTAVFSTQFGKNTMRTKPLDVHNPKSVKQRQQRNKFTIMVELARLLMEFIRVTFKQVAKRMSQYNAFMATNISFALTGVFPNFTIDYTKLIVSKGTLRGAEGGAVASVAGHKLNVTWTDNSGDGSAQPTDNAVVLVINDTKKSIISDMTTKTRIDGAISFATPGTWVNDTVHVYLSFKVPDKDIVSDSTMIGSVAVLP